jgi:hypothetical protein
LVTESGRNIWAAVGARNDSHSGSAHAPSMDAPSANAAGRATKVKVRRLEDTRLAVKRTRIPESVSPENDLKTNFASPSRQPQQFPPRCNAGG